MQNKKRSWPMARVGLLAVCLSVTGFETLESWAQEAVSTSSPLKPFVPRDAKSLDKSQQSFQEVIARLSKQQEVREGVSADLRKRFDGSPKMALTIHVLEVLGLKDEAQSLMLATAATDKLRWQLQWDRDEKDKQATLETQKVKGTEARLDQARDLVIELREQKDETGELAGAERELLGLIRLQQEGAARVAAYVDANKEHDSELADLARFEKQIDGLVRVARVEAERRRAAIEHEGNVLVSQSVMTHRKEMRETLSALQSRWKKAEKDVRNSGTLPNSGHKLDTDPPVGAELKRAQLPPLSEEESQLIEQELAKAKK